MHKALTLLRKIPKGKVATYKELARVCHTSPRAIGSIMASNKNPREFPCYKVVSSKGELCGYSGKGGLKTKKKLLANDGIIFVHSRVPLEYFWKFSN
ncbi:MAG: hypothetical protein A3B24_00380 [Candidatus Wildermuthbacteria bacterium RIFCSPLOWO2_01_FULL_48_16]|uniref:Methylated-DNA-[protein]-cysteine S-methyltransferase DNA binding domain-containing protein n=1 Tax=Candidatus Wildermuthbacteria bacterium RIFCSPLOWO2_01_FULL_48_16 TaxID=1802461 RepID=A0A1G2RMX0_9BACT|nr:MAG: hypothetical protein A3B24_00380 [Candidatus Wildermuthbacteria bacterium RIFCSPLOWO2_01_FULL_48_16]